MPECFHQTTSTIKATGEKWCVQCGDRLDQVDPKQTTLSG